MSKTFKLILILLVFSIAIPVTAKLVKQNQDNRNLAAGEANRAAICSSIKTQDNFYRGKRVCSYVFGGITNTWYCDDLQNNFCSAINNPKSGLTATVTKSVSCTSGEKKCEGTNLKTCNSLGEWVVSSCENGCTCSGTACQCNEVELSDVNDILNWIEEVLK